jgi:hypothetical protein
LAQGGGQSLSILWQRWTKLIKAKIRKKKKSNPSQHDFARMAEPNTMQGVGKQLKLIYRF